MEIIMWNVYFALSLENVANNKGMYDFSITLNGRNWREKEWLRTLIQYQSVANNNTLLFTCK